MKVTMLEYYQGSNINGALAPKQVADVDDALGAWLVANGKAVEVKVEKPKEEPKPETEPQDEEVVYPKRRGRK